MTIHGDWRFTAAVVLVLLAVGPLAAGGRAAPAAPGGEGAKPPTTLDLKLRKRVETKEGSGRFHTLVQPTQWDAGKTAVVVCDMWDLAPLPERRPPRRRDGASHERSAQGEPAAAAC